MATYETTGGSLLNDVMPQIKQYRATTGRDMSPQIIQGLLQAKIKEQRANANAARSMNITEQNNLSAQNIAKENLKIAKRKQTKEEISSLGSLASAGARGYEYLSKPGGLLGPSVGGNVDMPYGTGYTGTAPTAAPAPEGVSAAAPVSSSSAQAPMADAAPYSGGTAGVPQEVMTGTKYGGIEQGAQINVAAGGAGTGAVGAQGSAGVAGALTAEESAALAADVGVGGEMGAAGLMSEGAAAAPLTAYAGPVGAGLLGGSIGEGLGQRIGKRIGVGGQQERKTVGGIAGGAAAGALAGSIIPGVGTVIGGVVGGIVGGIASLF